MTQSKRRLRIAMLGLRSLHGGHGGVETHIKHLAHRLAEGDAEVLVLERAPYVTPDDPVDPANVKRWSLPAPKDKHLEALIHSTIGVFAAAWWRPDVLHVHAIGPALVTPLGRLMGMRVVVTHHGDDYNREKWSKFAKTMIRLGEQMAGRFSNGIISVSGLAANRLRTDYPRQRVEHVPNGVPPTPAPRKTWPNGVDPGQKYILNVARLVPEKRQIDLVRAFEKVRDKHPDWSLVLVGSAVTASPYEAEILQAAAPGSRIQCLGHQTGDDLAAAFAGADLFVLPSSHEGNPIAMLEAMSASLPILASDIPPNLEIELPAACYYPLGDTDSLAKALDAVMGGQAERRIDWSDKLQKYRWEEVTRRTASFYNQVCGRT